MFDIELLLATAAGERLGGADSFLKFLGKTVEVNILATSFKGSVAY
jgi:hypothetical protein